MGDTDQLIDAALEAAGGLPSPRAFQVWCNAYRAGRPQEEEAVKQAFRSVWAGLAAGRYDDFMGLLAAAEARLIALEPAQIVGWTQAAAARAVLELIQSRRLQSSEAMSERRKRAGDLAAAAVRFAEAARLRTARAPLSAFPPR